MPMCPIPNHFVISENNAPGTIVGILNGIDSNNELTKTIRYEIENKQELFTLDPYTGIVSCISLIY